MVNGVKQHVHPRNIDLIKVYGIIRSTWFVLPPYMHHKIDQWL